MEQRLEVQVDGSWHELDLFDNTPPQFNYTINDLGSPAVRKISYSDTLAIRKTGNNIRVLDLNKFNLTKYAERINTKYQYRRYMGSRLVNEGTLVINNVPSDVININLIDNAINLLDIWAGNKVNEMFLDPAFRGIIPVDYHDSYDALATYLMSPVDYTPSLTVIPNIDSISIPIAAFPNTLNTIGDKFQLNADGSRYKNALNAYQTRPLLNARALMELACYRFGFTPEFSTNVDTANLDNLYIVSKGTQKPLPTQETINLQCVDTLLTYKQIYNPPDYTNYFMYYYDLVDVPNALRTVDVVGWVNPPHVATPLNATQPIIRPIYDNYFNGELIAEVNPSNVRSFSFMGVWMNEAGTAPVFNTYIQNGITPLPDEIAGYVRLDYSGTPKLKMIFNKVGLQRYPLGADPNNFLGVMIYARCTDIDGGGVPIPVLSMDNTFVTETYIPYDGTAYDENQQYIYGVTNLLYDLPDEPVLKVISGVMKQQGILLNINDKTKVARFYNYVDVLNYSNPLFRSLCPDWSEYYLETITDDTLFSDNFGQVNRIGLSNPYVGNIYQKTLVGVGTSSKYKPTADFFLADFSDVENALVTNVNDTTTPINYLEFTNKGLGIVERVGDVSGLGQVRYKATDETPIASPIALPSIPLMQNVNYATLPSGIDAWYNLVAQSAKITVRLLLPQDVVNNFNPELPVYISKLGRLFIVNLIKEYKGGQYPCEVQLIHIP